MSMGTGCVYSMSQRQRLNTRSSTEAELVGVNNAMNMVLWCCLFLEAQGFMVTDNILYQDNQSAMLLEKNGKMSSNRRTRHLEIRFFFVTDNVANKKLRIEYCPTDDMVADFFTKPLNGSKFRRFRDFILGLPPDDNSALTSLVCKECVETNSHELVTDKGHITTKGRDVPGYDDDDKAKVATSWVDVVRKKNMRDSNQLVGKQSVAMLTLFTKPKIVH